MQEQNLKPGQFHFYLDSNGIDTIPRKRTSVTIEDIHFAIIEKMGIDDRITAEKSMG